jgi:hypothetical protein
MSITAGNASYAGTGPTQTGQILAQNLSSPAARMLVGTATVTGDAASSTFDVNFIDGTKDIGFTPSVIVCQRSGGAATSTIAVVSAVPVDGTKFTVNTSAAVNAATFIVSFVAYK